MLSSDMTSRCSVAVQGLDIGPDALQTFKGALAGAQTVLWNGPMGVFEWSSFAAGTLGIAHALASLTDKVRRSSFPCPPFASYHATPNCQQQDGEFGWCCATATRCFFHTRTHSRLLRHLHSESLAVCSLG